MASPIDPTTPLAHRKPVIVGREREQALLRQALGGMLAGHSGLVLVSGEAGIGKTTLVEWLAQAAEEAGALVLWGHAYDLTVTPPYGPWLELLDSYPPGESLPALPAFVGNLRATAALGSQERLFTATRDFLAEVAARQPLVLILEDLHWADQDSLDFLRILARQIADQPLLLVATYRSDELHRRHPLYGLIPLLVREAEAARLELRPLDNAAQQALIQRRYRLSEGDQIQLERYLAARAEGNPLYAGELLRTLEEEGALTLHGNVWRLSDLEQVRVPPLLRQVIEGRLNRLNDDSRQLLQVASIIGQEVPLDLWQRVAEADDARLITALEVGREARLLEETPGEPVWRFHHALIREALYEEMVSVRRRTWHRRVAETLAQTTNPDPDQIGYHFQQAGDDRAVDWLLKAGEQAERAYAWIAAAERFDAALAKLTEQEAPAMERAVLLYRIATLLKYADPARALALMEEGGRLASEAGEQLMALDCQLESGLYLCFLGQPRAGIERIEQAVDALDGLSDTERAGHASLAFLNAAPVGSLVLWLSHVGRLGEAYARGLRMVAEVAPPVPRPGSGGSSYADGLFGLALAQALLGQPEDARRMMRAAGASYRQVEHHSQEALVAANTLELVQLPYFTEEREGRWELARSAASAMKRVSAARPDWPADYQPLPILILEGAWPVAWEWTRKIGGLVARYRALLAYYRGEPEIARQFVAAQFPDGPKTEPGNMHLWNGLGAQLLAAELALDAEELGTAHDWLEARDRWLDWSGAVLGRAESALLWARFHHAAGDHRLAHQQAEHALAHASAPRQPLALVAIHRFLGQLDTEAKRFGESEEHVQHSLTLAETCAAPFERALTLLELARLRAAQGAAAEAKALLAEVRAICEPLGVKPTLAQVARLEERLVGQRARRPFGLSPRELEVLQLVAEGLTDAEIAERLFISRRTVGNHLGNILNKLGVSSRAAAVAVAARQGLL